MRRMVVLLAIVVSACGKDSPAAPTIPSAVLASSGTLIVQACNVLSGTLASCVSYNGTVKNAGPGCASNVRGVTKTFVTGTQQQIGSSEWTYSGLVRVGEEVGYVGFNLAVPLPLVGGWVYTTTPTWDNVKCP